MPTQPLRYRVSPASPAVAAAALLIINMGVEMVYILEQRLRAQNVVPEKAHKVLSDVVRAMYRCVTWRMRACGSLRGFLSASTCARACLTFRPPAAARSS